MNWQALYVYGAGRHGKVVADVVRAAGLPGFAGFVDDDPARAGVGVLSAEVLEARRLSGDTLAVALGVGENSAAREALYHALKAKGVCFPVVVHPSAVVAPSARLGEGTVVMAGAIVNPDARVGVGCIVNTGAVIEHDVVLEDFAVVAPNATTGGGSSVGRLSRLGLGAVLLPDVRIGRRVEVGAGAVVTRDVPDDVVAFGVPARAVRPR